MKILRALLAAAGILLCCTNPSFAGELGHYAAGLPNIRDLLVPTEPGFYFAQYHYFYTADTFRNRDRDKVDEITVGPARGPNAAWPGPPLISASRSTTAPFSRRSKRRSPAIGSGIEAGIFGRGGQLDQDPI